MGNGITTGLNKNNSKVQQKNAAADGKKQPLGDAHGGTPVFTGQVIDGPVMNGASPVGSANNSLQYKSSAAKAKAAIAMNKSMALGTDFCDFANEKKSKQPSAASPQQPQPLHGVVLPPIRHQRQLDFSQFGQSCFTGHVADKYLRKHGKSHKILQDPMWTTHSADQVAAAVLEWALDRNATMFTHLFQPLGASGVRHGLGGTVQNALFSFGESGRPVWTFTADVMLQGETDGSSFPNGGLRVTHQAGAYTVLDPTSPMFLRGDCVHIPCVLTSWTGYALDEKTPLLRAQATVNKQCKKLLSLLNYKVDGVIPNIGLEQEYFLVPRKAYMRRMDLQLTGRTVLGKFAARGQEMSDHYQGPINQHSRVMTCIQRIQDECFQLGIPLKTRHREVAPNQYEAAPMFGLASVQVDQNLQVMQIIEEVAAQYGFAALNQEKPFAGINGSGKHNNFSLGTLDGVNLQDPVETTEASGNPICFAVVMAAIIQAVAENGDLMRMSIASPGNDFRLGCMEAPPAIISMYLGNDMTEYLDAFRHGASGPYTPKADQKNVGVQGIIAPFHTPPEDRNRTSPFPYGGCRFEFRAVGSAQNCSMVNTVLCTIMADAFAKFSARIEAGDTAHQVAADALNKNWQVIFNGNGYSDQWPIEARKRGLFECPSGVEAIQRLSVEKNLQVMEDMKVLTRAESIARTEVMHDQYSGLVEMEAGCMIDMFKQYILPVAHECAPEHVQPLKDACSIVEKKLQDMHDAEDSYVKATIARELRLDVMEEARKASDTAEGVIRADKWPFATYKDLLFLDIEEHL